MIATPARLALAVLLLGLATAGALGADDDPRVSVSLTPETLAPGETAVLRYTVLVPTWLSEPVSFPPLDQPNLRITLPERATVPTSQRLDGATWSGVTRAYRLTPLAPGDYALGDAPLEVTYADPESQAPVTRELTPETSLLTVTLPAAAEGLDPYVAAGSLTLEQQLEVVAADQAADQAAQEGDEQGETKAGTDEAKPDAPLVLSPGDSLTRTVTATVEGGSTLLLPPLIPSETPPGLGVYPETPRLTERDNGGTRIERVTYVAEGGVDGTLPAIQLRWLDLDGGEIATSRLPAVAVEAKGPVPTGADGRRRWPWLALLAAVIALSGLAWALGRRWPAWREILRQRAERSGQASLTRLRHAVAARDFAATRIAWREFIARAPALDAARHAAIEAALLALGRARFGPGATDSDAAWRQLSRNLPRHRALAGRPAVSPLPPLNPS